MIRRNLLRDELDRRVIRAALIAAAIALVLGWTAQKLEPRQVLAQELPAAGAVVSIEDLND